MLNGANPAGTEGSVNAPAMDTGLKLVSKMSILPLEKLAAKSSGAALVGWALMASPKYTAPVELLSTISCAAVALTAEAQAETVPSAVTKMKLGTFPCTRKPPVPLKTIPVGVEGAAPLADGGTVGLSALGVPLLL